MYLSKYRSIHLASRIRFRLPRYVAPPLVSLRSATTPRVSCSTLHHARPTRFFSLLPFFSLSPNPRLSFPRLAIVQRNCPKTTKPMFVSQHTDADKHRRKKEGNRRARGIPRTEEGEETRMRERERERERERSKNETDKSKREN